MHLYTRQKLLLSLLEAVGGSLGATDLQKLLFLYTRKWEQEPSFRFVPYHYGCFSFQADADLNKLLQKGLLESTREEGWTITQKAKPYLPKDTLRSLSLFVTRTVPERGRQLVRRVYREDPHYATRSRILKSTFPDKKKREALFASLEKPEGTRLFTIGYEGDSIDGYLDRLIRNDVQLLCDVRKNPLSRKTGFSKRQLSGYCERVGIEYRHIPELGIPGHRRRKLDGLADYERLFEEYEQEDLPEQGASIELIGELLRKHQRIALTCFEKEPEYCHRHCVAEAVEEQIKNCPSIEHI